jgi:hypothetical protein
MSDNVILTALSPGTLGLYVISSDAVIEFIIAEKLALDVSIKYNESRLTIPFAAHDSKFSIAVFDDTLDK